MAFGLKRKELMEWKEKVKKGGDRFFDSLLAGFALSGL